MRLWGKRQEREPQLADPVVEHLSPRQVERYACPKCGRVVTASVADRSRGRCSACGAVMVPDEGEEEEA